VLAQLAVMLADGGDCVSDLATLRDQPELFGRVASTPTAWRVIDSVHAEGLRRIAAGRAAARAGAWAAGARPATITLDFDATLVTAHSEKEEAAPNLQARVRLPSLAVLPGRDGRGAGRQAPPR
jgi:hypothetical protein